ncbi:hypothetical protein FQN55_005275 [Onygenales sp. PD_40]|nr:hypothetical protein FQN55_005275 [Onygenales sp. PD_40]
MPTTLNSIPFDLWHQIASRLDPQDYINLSFVNRQLYYLLKSELTARNSVQSFIAHTLEGKLATKGQITYQEALRRVYDVREAVATAQPYSATLLAYGESFLFNQGVLCYLDRGEIRTLDVHGAAREEQVVNIGAVLRRASSQVSSDFNEALEFSLLNYSDGIVACLCEIEERRSSYLLVIDVRSTCTRKGGRIILLRRLESSRRLFVRHNASVLFYGTHSLVATHGHHEWVIHGWRLGDEPERMKHTVQLENFVGSEIGSSLCFEIHDDHFYAVTNETGFEDEEIDWTSYYTCIRFPISDPKKTEWAQLWRRQHREGPINDTWTNISVRTDEATRQLVIVECRREWHLGGSQNLRTYYIQPLTCFETDTTERSDCNGLSSDEESDDDGESRQSSSPSPGFPGYLPISELPDDPLTSTLDEHSKPRYERPKKRIRRHYHREYDEKEVSSPERKDFILSKTKYRTYNYSASTFIDLVNDPPQPGGYATLPDQLRLRVGSRKRKCPINDAEGKEKGLLYTPDIDEVTKEPIEFSEEHFESRGIKLWPPRDSPPELLSLLCPAKKCGKVEAESDERSMVYSTEPPNPDGRRPIILVSFDPTIRFSNLKRLAMKVPAPDELNLPVEIDRKDINRADKGKQRAITVDESDKLSPLAEKSSLLSPAPVPWFRTETAMYLHINRSYWLR